MNGRAWLESLGPQRIRPGLARTRALLASLGNPERTYRSLLVAGTNGKGSTAATAAAILEAAGFASGLYTSPHLVRVNERVRLRERDVADERLDEVLALVAAASRGPEDLRPTYFEAMTVAAFELFRRARVEVAVVEVGIGGRLDATNVLDPDVSIVTNVSADHLDTLGPTLADVAREKAGVFRRGAPALTAAAGPTLEVLHAEARRIGARLVEVPPTKRFDSVSPLPGAHQRANLALAAAAAAAFGPLDEAAVRRGVAATRWPGRLQRVRRAGRRELILDGAHNEDGARALAAWLASPEAPATWDLLFGGLADKDLAALFSPLGRRARRVALTAPESPRAESPERLATRLSLEGAPRFRRVADALEALDGPAGEPPLLVAGSLYLVGETLAWLETPAARARG